MNIQLPPIVARHVDAVNAGDVAAIMSTFNDGALVNDVQREFWAAEAIRGFVEREIVGDNVRMEPVEAIVHAGLVILRARYDGTYDKTGLPDELILTNYFATSGEGIDTLIVIHNQAAQ